MIAGRGEEHLGLVLQPPKRLAVDNAVAIALERRANRIFRFRPQTAARRGAQHRLWCERFALTLLELFPYRRPHHAASCRSAARKLVPAASAGTPKCSASVWPRSAKVVRV